MSFCLLFLTAGKMQAKTTSIISAADLQGVNALLSSAVASAKMQRHHLQRANLHSDLCERRSYLWQQSCQWSLGTFCSFRAPTHAVLPDAVHWRCALTLSLLQCTALTQKKMVQCFVLCWISKLDWPQLAGKPKARVSSAQPAAGRSLDWLKLSHLTGTQLYSCH